jgi:hypothetical protein
MDEIAGGPLRRKAVTLIEAVLFISIALVLIIGGLVFYQQASLSMKVMNTKRHVEAALANIRAIQQQTRTWSGVSSNEDITHVLEAAGALTPITNGFGRMRITFKVGRLGDSMLPPYSALPDDICAATVIAVEMSRVPVAACTRMSVTDQNYSGFLSSGQVGGKTDWNTGPPNFRQILIEEIAPISPDVAAAMCNQGYLSTADGVGFTAYFFLEPASGQTFQQNCNRP